MLLETWKLIRDVNIELVWTRAYVETKGYERTDVLAKEVAAGPHDGTSLAYASRSEKPIKSAIAVESPCKCQERWENDEEKTRYFWLGFFSTVPRFHVARRGPQLSKARRSVLGCSGSSPAMYMTTDLVGLRILQHSGEVFQIYSFL
ncbi:hypothetical protein Trydic_g19706 [Trypoxylus dichotomus]